MKIFVHREINDVKVIVILLMQSQIDHINRILTKHHFY